MRKCTYLCNELCWLGISFSVGHYTQTVQPIFFKPAILLCTIDFYCFILLSLTLARGHKVSTQQNLLASFFAHFSSDQLQLYVVINQFKLNFLRLLLSKVY